jgi:SAM-dependent methyltransferase
VTPVPDLSTNLHLDMLAEAKRQGQPEKQGLYGLHWGDPQEVGWLRSVRDEFLLPFVHPDRHGVEIGPGGGRWTRYMLTFGRLYVVDFHQQLLDELAKNFRTPTLMLVKNNGTDFPGIPKRSIDFVFSFGVFVHLDLAIIEQYLLNLRDIIRPGGQIVLQYSDKTKPAAVANSTFSLNDPDRMRTLVTEHGYRVLREDLTTLPHSSVIQFARA